MKQLAVSAIRNGTVIDQIDSKSTFIVSEILRLQDEEQLVLVGINLSSKKLGKKGIIKIDGKSLTQKEVNKIALIAPDATLNIIKDYEVVKKIKVELPDKIEDIVKCFNPNCISNHQTIHNEFHVINKYPVKLRCHYCERVMSGKAIELNIGLKI